MLVLDTPAKSELKPGDILKRIDGAAVSSARDAYRLLRRLEEDAQAEVRPQEPQSHGRCGRRIGAASPR